jgi:hypothetical protein
VPIVEVDDPVEALLAMATPQQQPVLHYWRTHPEAEHLPPDRIVELQVPRLGYTVPHLGYAVPRLG